MKFLISLLEPRHTDIPSLGFRDYIRKGRETMRPSSRLPSALESPGMLVNIGLLVVVVSGCYQTTVFWEKSGSGKAEFQRATEECEALQRAAGIEGWRIHRCLEAKGWFQTQEVGEEPSIP